MWDAIIGSDDDWCKLGEEELTMGSWMGTYKTDNNECFEGSRRRRADSRNVFPIRRFSFCRGMIPLSLQSLYFYMQEGIRDYDRAKGDCD